MRARALDAVVGVQRRERRGGHGADRHRAGVRVRPARERGGGARRGVGHGVRVVRRHHGERRRLRLPPKRRDVLLIAARASAAPVHGGGVGDASVPMGPELLSRGHARDRAVLFLVAPVIAGQALGGWGAAVGGARRRGARAQTACFAAFSFPAPSSFRTERKRKQLREGKGSTSGQISGPGKKTTERATKGPKGRAMDDRLMILRDVDARTHAALFCAAPFASYAATHKNTLFSFVAFSRASSFSSSALLFEHVCSCALLLAFPPALMCLAASRGGLRWAFAEPGGRAAASLKTHTAAERAPRRATRGARRPGPDRARAGIATDTRRDVGARDASLTRRRATIVASTRRSRCSFGAPTTSRRRLRGTSSFRRRTATSPSRRRCTNHARGRGVPHRRRAFVAAATLCVSAVAAAAAIGVPGWLWPAAAARGV